MDCTIPAAGRPRHPRENPGWRRRSAWSRRCAGIRPRFRNPRSGGSPSSGAVSPLLPTQTTAPSRGMATAAPVAPVSECAATAIVPRMVSVGWVSDAIIFRSFTKIKAAFDCRMSSSETSDRVRAGTRAPVDSGGVGVRGGRGAIFTTCWGCARVAAKPQATIRPSVRQTTRLSTKDLPSIHPVLQSDPVTRCARLANEWVGCSRDDTAIVLRWLNAKLAPSRGKTQHEKNHLRRQRTHHRRPGSLPRRPGRRHHRLVAAVPVPSRRAHAEFRGQHSHHLPDHAAEGEAHSLALGRYPARGRIFQLRSPARPRTVFASLWPPGCCSFLLPRKAC